VSQVQVVDAETLDVDVVAWASGDDAAPTLIGVFPEVELYVISDPDLLSTQGLARGANAALLYRFFTTYLKADGLVMDELMHGFPPKSESIWSELASFPLVVLTAHLLGLLALALWATTSRFGKPADRPPRVPPGKVALIDNTATLLALGGHVGHGLRAYVRGTVRALAAEYALPQRLSDEERLQTIARLGRERGASVDLERLAAQAATVGDRSRETWRAVSLARKVYRFRTEMSVGYQRSK
jgi:hypothetical protein